MVWKRAVMSFIASASSAISSLVRSRMRYWNCPAATCREPSISTRKGRKIHS